MHIDSYRAQGPSRKGQDSSLPHRAGQEGMGAPGPSDWNLPWKVLPHRRWPAGWVRRSEACLRKTCGRPRQLLRADRHYKTGWQHGQEEQLLTQIPSSAVQVLCLRWRLSSRPAISTEILRNEPLPDIKADKRQRKGSLRGRTGAPARMAAQVSWCQGGRREASQIPSLESVRASLVIISVTRLVYVTVL